MNMFSFTVCPVFIRILSFLEFSAFQIYRSRILTNSINLVDKFSNKFLS